MNRLFLKTLISIPALIVLLGVLPAYASDITVEFDGQIIPHRLERGAIFVRLADIKETSWDEDLDAVFVTRGDTDFLFRADDPYIHVRDWVYDARGIRQPLPLDSIPLSPAPFETPEWRTYVPVIEVIEAIEASGFSGVLGLNVRSWENNILSIMTDDYKKWHYADKYYLESHIQGTTERNPGIRRFPHIGSFDMGGAAFSRGLDSMWRGSITYDITNRGFEQLTGYVGRTTNFSTSVGASGRMTVYGDGSPLYYFDIDRTTQPTRIVVDIPPGTREIRISMDTIGIGFGNVRFYAPQEQ